MATAATVLFDGGISSYRILGGTINANHQARRQHVQTSIAALRG